MAHDPELQAVLLPRRPRTGREPRLWALALALASQPACATLLEGDLDRIRIATDPPQAEVLVDGASRGNTPGEVVVDASEPHEIVLRAAGHRDQVFYVQPDFQAGYLALDLLLLLPGVIPGLVALIVDGSTGAWYAAEPTEVSAVMVPAADAPPPAGPAPSLSRPGMTPPGGAPPTPALAPASEPEPEPADADGADADDDVPPAPPPLIPDDELPLPPP